MNLSIDKKEELMRLVMQEVDEAIKEGNSPFGAILIDENGNIIEKAHNTAKSMGNPILHAEINLISKACKKLHTMDLSDYCIMSNAWSCSMCMSACIKAKIQNYIYGAPSEETMNPNVTIFDIKDKSKTELNIEIGILENECKLQIENARKS
jgi:tRNA(Arg) A34 adenosine deaminase TadA